MKEKKEDDMEDYERGMRFPCKNLEISLMTKTVAETQESHPITSCSYDQGTYELVIRRWKAEQQAEDIRLFSAVELKLLHPSYIEALDKTRFPEVRNKLAKEDMLHFLYYIDLLATAYEPYAVTQALAGTITDFQTMRDLVSMRINDKGFLVVTMKDGTEVEFSSDQHLIYLDKETIDKMLNTGISYMHDDQGSSVQYFVRAMRICAKNHERLIEESAAGSSEAGPSQSQTPQK